jgi:hypothetical protein
MATPNLTVADLRAAFCYCPHTGALTWRYSPIGAVRAGSLAGSLYDSGYIIVRFGGRVLRAHRIAWALMTGEMPAAEIDHINGNRADNRWSNLRDVSRSHNAQNQRSKNGKLLGASWNRHRKVWTAAIFSEGRQRYIGAFDTEAAAHGAYLEAKRRLHPGCTI